jgi:hypothetical protein
LLQHQFSLLSLAAALERAEPESSLTSFTVVETEQLRQWDEHLDI